MNFQNIIDVLEDEYALTHIILGVDENDQINRAMHWKHLPGALVSLQMDPNYKAELKTRTYALLKQFQSEDGPPPEKLKAKVVMYMVALQLLHDPIPANYITNLTFRRIASTLEFYDPAK